MDDTTSTYRAAIRIGRLVRAHPGETLGMMRKRLANRERSWFVDGCALALHFQWVKRDEAGRLQAGPSQPSGVPLTPTLEDRVVKALEKLRAEPGSS